MLSEEIERLNGVIEKKNNEIGSLQRSMQEISGMNLSITPLHEKLSRVSSENAEISNEMREIQEHLRLSNNQNQKLSQELNDSKRKIR